MMTLGHPGISIECHKNLILIPPAKIFIIFSKHCCMLSKRKYPLEDLKMHVNCRRLMWHSIEWMPIVPGKVIKSTPKCKYLILTGNRGI